MLREILYSLHGSDRRDGEAPQQGDGLWQLASTKEQEDGINKWVELIKQFSSPTELTADMLNTLIEKILVHEATKDEDGNRVQEIEIVYRFVGKID